MDQHLTAEQIERTADGEIELTGHVESCARCAAAVLEAERLKSAVRAAMQTDPAPAALRRQWARQRSGPSWWWIPVAAAMVIVIAGAMFVGHQWSRGIRSELVDMHVTLLAGANPIDVVSTDLHTVRPWFEGKVPFAVPVPDLSSTPFRLIGGRVVFWRDHPGAYLLIGKGAHRISLFVFRDEDAPEAADSSTHGINIVTWHQGGLKLIAVAEVPASDLQPLRAAFVGR